MMAVTAGNENNAVFQHVKNKNHPIDSEISAVIYISDNERNPLVVESTLIKSQETFNKTKLFVSIDNIFFCNYPETYHILVYSVPKRQRDVKDRATTKYVDRCVAYEFA